MPTSRHYSMPKFRDLTGLKFNRLLVISKSTQKTTSNKIQWNCVCDCGSETVVSGNALVSCTTKSCGCLNTERSPLYDEKVCYTIYRNNAKKRNLPFSLSFQEFLHLYQSPCLYCGVGPALGVDREDNAKGYDTTNSKPCCFDCNNGKYTYSRTDFIEWVSKVHNNLARKHVL